MDGCAAQGTQGAKSARSRGRRRAGSIPLTMPPLNSRSLRSLRRCPAIPAVLLSLLLAACGGTGSKRVSYDPESFNSTSAHTRIFEASEAQTCEAARRALLSQGYMITAANSDLATGRKSFQPDTEVHVEVEFRVVCARDAAGGKGAPPSTIAFVSALQDRYTLKKVNNSASVGVGVLGSVSLPYSSSADALVKVASETVTDERFYERFYDLIERFLVVEAPAEAAPPPPPTAAAPAQPAKPAASMPVPAPAVPASPVPAPVSTPPTLPPPAAPGSVAPAQVTPAGAEAPAPVVPAPAAPAPAPASTPTPTPTPAPEAAPPSEPAPADKTPVAPSPSRG